MHMCINVCQETSGITGSSPIPKASSQVVAPVPSRWVPTSCEGEGGVSEGTPWNDASFPLRTIVLYLLKDTPFQLDLHNDPATQHPGQTQ